MTVAPVVRTVTVSVPPERAFAIFTERIGEWWPLATHSPAHSLSLGLTFVGGRLVEIRDIGDHDAWGDVTEWDPPRRLAFTWHPGGAPQTSIAVDFEDSAGPEGSERHTRVVLTHEGWEVYGEAAADRRTGYDGEFAWGWILRLFELATSGPTPDAVLGTSEDRAYDVTPLRAGYEAVARALEPGNVGAPATGEWTARQVAGHVITNAELMATVIDDVQRGAAARLYGPDDHAEKAVSRCDGHDYPEVADQVRRAGAELVARCVSLSVGQLEAPVSTYIEHHGQVVVDGVMSLGALLDAEVHRHLPAHADQIADLAS